MDGVDSGCNGRLRDGVTLDEARAELATLRKTAADPAVAALRLEFNSSGQVLGIASEVLAGQIAAAEGDLTGAVARLREAARLEDEMVYGEPPEWTVPVRHDLGAALLRAGLAAEAETVYRADLARFPENVWSLAGLAESLTTPAPARR